MDGKFCFFESIAVRLLQKKESWNKWQGTYKEPPQILLASKAQTIAECRIQSNQYQTVFLISREPCILPSDAFIFLLQVYIIFFQFGIIRFLNFCLVPLIKIKNHRKVHQVNLIFCPISGCIVVCFCSCLLCCRRNPCQHCWQGFII